MPKINNDAILNRMKFILTLALLLVTAITPVLAAPGALVSLSADKRFVYMTFTDLRNVSRVNYTLTYDTISSQKGFESAIKFKSKTSRISRRQILGTCSSGRCVYHQGIKNVQLDATFTLRSGGTINLTKNI